MKILPPGLDIDIHSPVREGLVLRLVRVVRRFMKEITQPYYENNIYADLIQHATIYLSSMTSLNT